MSEVFNIYCDESCHLERDESNSMGIGAVWCPKDKTSEINTKIKEIKEKHRIQTNAEVKWTKASPGNLSLYIDLLDYFFENSDLHFRCLLIPDKLKLDHRGFNQTHNEWYYKMYFNMLKVIFRSPNAYYVYIDIKDTNSYINALKLHEVSANNERDFSHSMIRRVQPIRSDEVQIMQIVDVLVGAIVYNSRIFAEGHIGSLAKRQIIDRIIERSGCTLDCSTASGEEKFNVFIWDSDWHNR